MKRKMIQVLIILVLLTFAATAAVAEPYKGEAFPPNEVLAAQLPTDQYGNIRILGKKKQPDGSYEVYYLYDSERMGNKDSLGSVTVIRLDSGLWIINKNFSSGFKILSK